MQAGWGMWDANWGWSGALFVITIAVHAVGVVAIARGLAWYHVKGWHALDARRFTPSRSIALIVIVAMCLSALHAVESVIWAFAYVQLGAFSSPALALLYSVDSMTTRGSGALPIAPHWAMMGATEAGNGMLLFGISTAFLFALMHDLWRSHLLHD